jgi:hypothetical protein
MPETNSRLLLSSTTTNATLQLLSGASVLSEHCSNATAVQNNVVDGHVTFIVSLRRTGPDDVRRVTFGSTNYTLEIRDDDSRLGA